MKLVATCLFGLEKLLGEEIEKLGYTRLQTIDGRVIFEGDARAVVRCNLWLRYAERLFILLGDFPAASFEELFEGTRACPLEEYIGREDAFPVKGHSVHSKLTSIPDCQSIVKKAAATRLGERWKRGWLAETGITYQLEFFILNDRCTLLLDTSGVPLHKRGYRPQSNAAPLRETLAAAMVTLARPRDNVLLWDPMCGSGTIPIEAALLMTNTAPGLNRSFAAEKFPAFPAEWWEDARDEAVAVIREDCAFEAYGSDIDPECVALSSENVRRAGMSRYVKIFRQNALEISAPGRRGTIVCNPPYGERMGSEEECVRLYREMGKHFRSLAPWQVYIICSHEDFERLYGKRADKVRRLYNGMIRCGYYQYFK